MARKSTSRPNPALRGMLSRWLVHEGAPSWHQRRAGHASAAASVFRGETAQADALEFRTRVNSRSRAVVLAWTQELLTPICEVK